MALALAFALAGPALIDLMTTAADVRAEARHYLPWLVAAPLIGVASWIFDGIFIGATLTRAMRQAMILSVAVYHGRARRLGADLWQSRPLGGV